MTAAPMPGKGSILSSLAGDIDGTAGTDGTDGKDRRNGQAHNAKHDPEQPPRLHSRKPLPPFSPGSPGSPAALAGYGIACAATAAVLGLRLLLLPMVGPGAPLMAFIFSVLAAAWFGGLGPGLFATSLGLLLGKLFFIEPLNSVLIQSQTDAVRLITFALIGLCISLLSHSRQRSAASARTAEEQQRRFLREVLLVATDGRLRLCDTAEELPPPPGATGTDSAAGSAPIRLAISSETLSEVRHLALSCATSAGLDEDRAYDLLSAVGEAAMNAIVHGGGQGEALFFVDESAGLVQVRISDQGAGIAEGALHRATLERGYTTAGSLGHGFWMILHTCDRVFLLTGPTGTTLVLEQERAPKDEGETPWIRDLGEIPDLSGKLGGLERGDLAGTGAETGVGR